MSCLCVCKCSPPGYAAAFGMLTSYQGHTTEKTAVLCPFWRSLTLFACSSLPLFLFLSLCLVRLPLTLSVSISLYLNHSFPCFSLLLPLFFLHMPPWSEIFSHLFHPSCAVFPLFSFFSPAISHPTITLPSLSIPPNKSPFISVYLGLSVSFSPCITLPWFFLVFLPSYLYSLSCFSYPFPTVRCTNLCSLPSLSPSLSI